MLVCFIKFSKLLLKGYLLLKRKNIVMENKDLNNGSQENEWDEIIKNLNKKNSGIKEKSEEADIFFQKIKNGLKGKYDDLNFDNTFWGIKDEVESDAEGLVNKAIAAGVLKSNEDGDQVVMVLNGKETIVADIPFDEKGLLITYVSKEKKLYNQLKKALS
jgi:hypothetical protein